MTIAVEVRAQEAEQKRAQETGAVISFRGGTLFFGAFVPSFIVARTSERVADEWLYDADAALEAISTRDFELVVCDLHLDETSGTDLHAEVCRRFPNVADRFLFMTGSHPDRVPEPLLAKPFELQELRAAIARTLLRSVPALSRA